MDEQSSQGMLTRSKAALLKERVLAPSKLNVQHPAPTMQPLVASGGTNEQQGTISSPAHDSSNIYRDTSSEDQCDSSPKSQDMPPRTIKAPNLAIAEEHSIRAQANQTCQILRELVVCCPTCKVLFQRQPNCPALTCPVCSQFKPQNQWLELALSELRAGNAQITKRLAELESTLEKLQTEVISLKKIMQNEALGVQMIRSVNSADPNKSQENMDIDNALTSDTPNLSDKRKQFEETRERLEGLLNDSNAKANQLEMLCSRAEGYLVEMHNATNLKPSGGAASVNEAADTRSIQLGKESIAKKSAIIVGDSNVVRFSETASSMLQMDDRCVVRGAIGFTLMESADFCQKWLQEVKGSALIVLHSGLQDIISYSADQADYTPLIDSICTRIRDLAESCANSGVLLKICSVPEVVDFINRRDYRKIAFDLNSALRNLSSELSFEFLDVAVNTSGHAHLTTYDGLHFNKAGQLAVLKHIVTAVAEWLEIEPDWSLESKDHFTKQDFYRRRGFSSRSRGYPLNRRERSKNLAQSSFSGPEARKGSRRFARGFPGEGSNKYSNRRVYQSDNRSLTAENRDHRLAPTRIRSGPTANSSKPVHRLGESVNPSRNRYDEGPSECDLNPWRPGFEPCWLRSWANTQHYLGH